MHAYLCMKTKPKKRKLYLRKQKQVRFEYLNSPLLTLLIEWVESFHELEYSDIRRIHKYCMEFSVPMPTNPGFQFCIVKYG